jgi:hypothetical protein
MSKKTPFKYIIIPYVCIEIIYNLKQIKMNNQEITVVYKWTAKPGKADELKAIYREVEKQMKETEPHYSRRTFPSLTSNCSTRTISILW